MMSGRYSVIDVGSNSIRLMNCMVVDGRLTHCEKHIRTTKLGKGVDATGKLSEASMKDSFEALLEFKSMMASYDGEFIGAFATSAVRDALNGGSFAEESERLTGFKMHIIQGDREARLGYLGVAAGLPAGVDKLVVLDIGGGSTEVIAGDRFEYIYSKSFNIGAVRMTDACVDSDPPTEKQLECVVESGKAMFCEAASLISGFEPEVIVGIGGTITTLQAMTLEMESYDRDRIHNSRLSMKDILAWREVFERTPLSERKKLKGLQPKRADIIPAGAAILEAAMQTYGFKEIVISDYDNLEGLLVEAGVLKR